MTDFDRIKDTLVEHDAGDDKLATALLNLFIGMAGERLIEKERVKADIYKRLLTNKMIKPEYYKLIYKTMKKSEEKLK